MKALHCMSSGQDSTLSLYNLLRNTDHEVVAGYWRYTHFFSKNHLDFCEYYIEKIVDWLRTNVRDFQFRVERAPSPTWSFFLPPEHRIYDDVVTKEILEKYWNDELHNASDDMGMLGDKGMAWILERFYGHYYWMNEINKHSRNKIDYVQTGNDRSQIAFGFCKFIEDFWKDICSDVLLKYPLAEENMGRVAIYDAIPDGLKNVMNQCDDTERNGENWCGHCTRCLTRQVHESGMSVEETEKIFAVKEKYLSEIAVDTSKTKSVRNFYTSNLRKMLQIQRERNKKELSFDNTTTIL
jgi:hypothetical protein